MQHSLSSAKNTWQKIFRYRNQILAATSKRNQNEVFINHHGIDTKKNVTGLLYNHLKRLGIQPFLDSKSMKPGDKLFDKIDVGVMECKVGVAVFSPNYCKSYFCLHELALMTETKKKIVPIFVNVKPSELRVMYDGKCPSEDLERFGKALEEAKYTVGLTCNPSTGEWSEFLENAADAVVKNLLEAEEAEIHYSRRQRLQRKRKL